MTGRQPRAKRQPRAQLAAGRIVQGARDGAAWRDLLDPHQADRLANAVRVAVNNLAAGYPSLLHIDLRAEVLQPAEAYLAEQWSDTADESRADIAACRQLIEQTARLAELIEDQYPFHEGAGQGHAQPMRAAWSAFIEHAAAPELAHLIAQRSRTAADNASSPRKPRTSTLTGETLTRELLLQRVLAGKAAHKLQKTVMADLATEFGLSVKTLQREMQPLTWRDLKT